jgi:ubiquinone/menaquinone biosynthesis C-methylase UbiE
MVYTHRPMNTLRLSELERLTTIVYGDTFALYDDAAFNEFLAPLYARLRANGIGTEVFAGKRCLDAGFGGGRGSVLMAECGAAEVVGVDLSARNVETARKRVEERGLAQCTFVQGSLDSLAFGDEAFDIVWCNGVLHHSDDPDAGLSEVTRVLRTGGRLWLYLYGSGGVYWFVIDWIRSLLVGVDIERAVAQLQLMGISVRRIAEWIDDWFVPHLRRYTQTDVERRLVELGYDDTSRLDYGTLYDTSQRRVGAGSEQRALMGEGDLRFFATKVGAAQASDHVLPDPADGKGSDYADPSEVTRLAGPLADIQGLLRDLGAGTEAQRLMVAASVHRATRALLEQDAPVELAELEAHLAGVRALIAVL